MKLLGCTFHSVDLVDYCPTHSIHPILVFDKGINVNEGISKETKTVRHLAILCNGPPKPKECWELGII